MRFELSYNDVILWLWCKEVICKDVSYLMWFFDFVFKLKNICMKFKGVIFLDNGLFILCFVIMLKKLWNE